MGHVEMHSAVGAPVAVIEVEMTKETLEPGRTESPGRSGTSQPAEEKEGQRCSLHVSE